MPIWDLKGTARFGSRLNKSSDASVSLRTFGLNLKLSERLIVPQSITIFGCVTLRASPNKIILCFVAREQSLCSNMKTSLLFLSFFDFCFKYLFYLFYWFQLCLLIYAHRHQIPLRTALSELIGSSFLFILTGWTPLMVEFLVVLDGSVRWAQQEGSRPQRCLLFISRWELFLFSQFSQRISLFGLQLWGAHMKRRRMIQTETSLSISFSCILSVNKWKPF